MRQLKYAHKVTDLDKFKNALQESEFTHYNYKFDQGTITEIINANKIDADYLSEYINIIKVLYIEDASEKQQLIISTLKIEEFLSLLKKLNESQNDKQTILTQLINLKKEFDQKIITALALPASNTLLENFILGHLRESFMTLAGIALFQKTINCDFEVVSKYQKILLRKNINDICITVTRHFYDILDRTEVNWIKDSTTNQETAYPIKVIETDNHPIATFSTTYQITQSPEQELHATLTDHTEDFHHPELLTSKKLKEPMNKHLKKLNTFTKLAPSQWEFIKKPLHQLTKATTFSAKIKAFFNNISLFGRNKSDSNILTPKKFNYSLSNYLFDTSNIKHQQIDTKTTNTSGISAQTNAPNTSLAKRSQSESTLTPNKTPNPISLSRSKSDSFFQTTKNKTNKLPEKISSLHKKIKNALQPPLTRVFTGANANYRTLLEIFKEIIALDQQDKKIFTEILPDKIKNELIRKAAIILGSKESEDLNFDAEAELQRSTYFTNAQEILKLLDPTLASFQTTISNREKKHINYVARKLALEEIEQPATKESSISIKV